MPQMPQAAHHMVLACEEALLHPPFACGGCDWTVVLSIVALLCCILFECACVGRDTRTTPGNTCIHSRVASLAQRGMSFSK